MPRYLHRCDLLSFACVTLIVAGSLLVGCNKSDDTSAAPPAGGGNGGASQPAGGGAAAGSGQAAYEANCRCHGKIGAGRGGRAPDLSHEGAKHDADWIAAYAKDPRSKDAGSRMPPQSRVSDADLKSIGDYLAAQK
jgi:cytochrome c553